MFLENLSIPVSEPVAFNQNMFCNINIFPEYIAIRRILYSDSKSGTFCFNNFVF